MPELDNQSFVQRIFLLKAAMQMVQTNFLFGVGFGNFLPGLPFLFSAQLHYSTIFLQPVHNIFFLIAAETGVTGLLFVFWFLYKTLQKLKTIKTLLFIVIISLGMFDHYFLTLQQGQLLLTLILAICWI